MDMERKGVQSYQSLMYARFLCFGNGALTALHDQSDGFFRRQIVLTTKDRPSDIIGKIIVLVFVGRTDEAEWSAEFEYPDISVKTADEVLKMSHVERELLALIEKEKIAKD